MLTKSKDLGPILTVYPAKISSAPQTTADESSRKGWLGRAAQEPFVHFALLGLLIWFGVEFWPSDSARYTIYAGPEQRQRIATAYERQFGQPPTPQQIQGLLDRYIRDEIYFHEALAWNLDKDDEIIRRRLLQKYEFLRTDLVVPSLPDASTLKQWYDKNQTKYAVPERVTFSHVYFSTDSRGDAIAKLRASDALQELMRARLTRAPERGDAFSGPRDVSALSAREANRLFGQSELTEELFNLPLGQWAGPFRSGYGWHLVYVTQRIPSEVPPLAQIQNQVRTDYTEEQRNLINVHNFEKLRTKYTVRYDDAPN